MWKRLLETTKQVVSSKQAIPYAAVAPKPATPAAAPSASKRGAPVAAPKLSTLKSPSYRRRAAAGPATTVTQASLLRLKQAAASKKTNLPSSPPLNDAHALGNKQCGNYHLRPLPTSLLMHTSFYLRSHPSPFCADEDDPPEALTKALMFVIDGTTVL